ncbi:MAG: mevalonate kinase [Bacteroidales bacterium]|jgi:mevalonate kinase|nr:mevalonate kinase [Bacteroidales bacterium]
MKRKPDIFYSKILLFGEYSILFDSMGLTIPYTYFKAELSFIKENKYTDLDYARKSNALLEQYIPYLQELKNSEKLKSAFNVDLFADDVQRGLYLESNIPQGYGVGSSGALVAALYKKYVNGVLYDDAETLLKQNNKLLQQFSQLESFFHGTSSGIDPLNCYIGQPLLIRSRNDISVVEIPRTNHYSEGGIFLINTGIPGKTEPLVNLFMERSKHEDFRNLIQYTMIPITNNCITYLISGDTDNFYSNLYKLSVFSLKNLKEMIPVNTEKMWEYGLESGNYYTKLCGSGGGGFLLGFTKNYPETKEILKSTGINVIPVYLNS